LPLQLRALGLLPDAGNNRRQGDADALLAEPVTEASVSGDSAVGDAGGRRDSDFLQPAPDAKTSNVSRVKKTGRIYMKPNYAGTGNATQHKFGEGAAERF